jgi:D-sedoheptulose 7-phosphate isomerase
MLRDDAGAKTEIGHFKDYARRLSDLLEHYDWQPVVALADELLDCARTGRQVFLAGNGGSAGNAIHLANDLLYAWSKKKGRGINVHALPANSAVMTCLANDEGYEEVFSSQIAVHGRRGDVLLVFSGSGNSKSILRALEEARKIGMKSFSVLAFDGGRAKGLSDFTIHFKVDDMQIAEDVQLIIGHMIVQQLYTRREALGRR